MSAMPEGNQPKKSSLWTGIAIGCLAIVLLGIGGCVVASCQVKKFAEDNADKLGEGFERLGKEAEKIAAEAAKQAAQEAAKQGTKEPAE